jgi:hypothetical protein
LQALAKAAKDGQIMPMATQTAPDIQINPVLTDRGSRYAVTVARLAHGPGATTTIGRAQAEAALAALKRDRKFARATHNSWAAILTDGGAVKNDDGEAGAGAIILKMLEREALADHLVVVTRWYGGVHLGGDRFAHVVTCVRAGLQALRDHPPAPNVAQGPDKKGAK